VDFIPPPAGVGPAKYLLEETMAEFATQLRPEPFLIYMNMARGIRMKYPSGWEKQEQSGQAGFMVMFLSPLENPSDRFRENVNLIVEAIPGPFSLEQIVAGTVQSIMQQAPVTFLQEPTPTTIGGVPGYQVSYTGPLPAEGMGGKWMQIFFIKNGKAFTFTYTAEATKFDRFLPTVQQIIASLEVK
jgi:eukaryotic-like serine/threonine-protein kinase